MGLSIRTVVIPDEMTDWGRKRRSCLVTDQQELELLAEIVERMPRHARQVLTMRKTYGFSHQQIADRLGLSLLLVEKHLAAAVIALADGLCERTQTSAP